MTGSTRTWEMASGPVPSESQWTLADRGAAVRRIEGKRKLGGHVIAYLVVNAFLAVAWAVTWTGYFWPGWVLGGWGMLLLLHAASVYLRKPLTEEDIEKELSRLSKQS